MVQRGIGRESLNSFGTWVPIGGLSQVRPEEYHVYGTMTFLNPKTSQHRKDDPRLATASYIGLSLTALRIVWTNFVSASDSSEEQFPFADDEAWAMAERLGAT